MPVVGTRLFIYWKPDTTRFWEFNKQSGNAHPELKGGVAGRSWIQAGQFEDILLANLPSNKALK